MRLIDADKFGEDLTKLWDYSCVDDISAIDVLKQALLALNNAPTIIQCSETSEGYPLMDLRPREKGEWEDYSINFYKCPECGYLLNKDCPHCQTRVILPKGGKEE